MLLMPSKGSIELKELALLLEFVRFDDLLAFGAVILGQTLKFIVLVGVFDVIKLFNPTISDDLLLFIAICDMLLCVVVLFLIAPSVLFVWLYGGGNVIGHIPGAGLKVFGIVSTFVTL